MSGVQLGGREDVDVGGGDEACAVDSAGDRSIYTARVCISLLSCQYLFIHLYWWTLPTGEAVSSCHQGRGSPSRRGRVLTLSAIPVRDAAAPAAGGAGGAGGAGAGAGAVAGAGGGAVTLRRLEERVPSPSGSGEGPGSGSGWGSGRRPRSRASRRHRSQRHRIPLSSTKRGFT